ncbi:hypothetical protein ACFRKE_10985 [Kitasatospora indigofera]|uniref:hypothetical protein n=1 Tax=Kitasatospora indigofera TaxID=67307 RepID=UPI0036A99160
MVAARALIHLANGACPGEVLAFAQAGYLSWPEVCSWSDDIEVTLALARRTLRVPASAGDEPLVQAGEKAWAAVTACVALVAGQEGGRHVERGLPVNMPGRRPMRAKYSRSPIS